MIVGIGTDIIDIRRIERSIDRFGDRFINRVFSQVERAKAESRMRFADTLAKRFAAKEACAKALGTGIYRGVIWRDLSVVNERGGKPTMQLSGAALDRLNALIPDGHVPNVQLTLTDDHPWAQAFVTIEAVPARG
ncbi:holo-[acyl-carrier-protein] synthase [Marinicauda pacifica]|uniref:Holo-[acyl-carrier-protein] synthase n=1 Tax=Marinicauda pacifica TaxID=1133559 RepID=A0A4S2HEV9_9PROT|nr:MULTISPECIES: holo-ACP synthase [Marinicauda]TGY94604.1 holo-ACP synthase [Marinicauda pacifica]GGE37231.1 holo-[acyl-carrier-protein] synthase [Marinicauda pacifica]